MNLVRGVPSGRGEGHVRDYNGVQIPTLLGDLRPKPTPWWDLTGGRGSSGRARGYARRTECKLNTELAGCDDKRGRQKPFRLQKALSHHFKGLASYTLIHTL